MGRVMLAKGDPEAARREFEIAVGKGYRAARIDLAQLGAADRAVELYEQSWQQGVPYAAFELGRLYETGVAANSADAWRWYRLAADAGEPNALARLAEREERAALAESDARKRTEHLFAAFTLYAAATERARLEDWPDEAWRTWRYRRATLARLLAREGQMQRVANGYSAIMAKWTPGAPDFGRRIEQQFGR
jgi:TPR repeat protein